MSLSRLNHGQPGVQAHPEIVQGTADLHNEIADALLPQAHPVFHNPTPLDAAVDVLDPEPPLVERLVGQVLLQGQLRTAGLLRRHEDFQIPPDLVVKCQAVDMVEVISLLIWRRNIIHTSRRNKKWRGEALSPSEVHGSTTKSGGMWKKSQMMDIRRRAMCPPM